MKNLFRTLMVITAFTGIVALSSCTKEDKCKNVTCQNGGACLEGTCTCAAGYEGTNCETEVRTKIIHTYAVDETCTTTGHATYSVTITASGTDVSKVLVSPFGGYPGLTGTVSVDGTSLSIASQTQGGFTYSGSGTINGGGTTLTVQYNISDGTTTESCSGTWTKQ